MLTAQNRDGIALFVWLSERVPRCGQIDTFYFVINSAAVLIWQIACGGFMAGLKAGHAGSKYLSIDASRCLGNRQAC